MVFFFNNFKDWFLIFIGIVDFCLDFVFFIKKRHHFAFLFYEFAKNYTHVVATKAESIAKGEIHIAFACLAKSEV